MNTLYVLVGNIGSGKSTFCKHFLKEHKEKIVCTCRDSLRYMIGGGDYIFDPDLEPFIVISHLRILEAFMNEGFDIIIDETNISSVYREDYLELAEYYDYQKIALVFPKLDKETSVSRRLQNDHGDQGREVWEGVWDKFNNKYEEPTKEEGFDEVRYIKD